MYASCSKCGIWGVSYVHPPNKTLPCMRSDNYGAHQCTATVSGVGTVCSSCGSGGHHV